MLVVVCVDVVVRPSCYLQLHPLSTGCEELKHRARAGKSKNRPEILVVRWGSGQRPKTHKRNNFTVGEEIREGGGVHAEGFLYREVCRREKYPRMSSIKPFTAQSSHISLSLFTPFVHES